MISGPPVRRSACCVSHLGQQCATEGSRIKEGCQSWYSNIHHKLPGVCQTTMSDFHKLPFSYSRFRSEATRPFNTERPGKVAKRPKAFVKVTSSPGLLSTASLPHQPIAPASTSPHRNGEHCGRGISGHPALCGSFIWEPPTPKHILDPLAHNRKVAPSMAIHYTLYCNRQLFRRVASAAGGEGWPCGLPPPRTSCALCIPYASWPSSPSASCLAPCAHSPLPPFKAASGNL